MSAPRHCPDCGTKLPPNSPAGLCPKCLLKAGSDDGSTDSHDEPTLVAASASVVEQCVEPGTEPDLRDRAQPPEIGAKVRYFGDYELLDEIARGGMGVVYKARQVRLNRTVALKMILAGQFAGGADVQRFQTEAEAAAQLDHPGIVPVFEVGRHDGHHFFSMGLVEGDSLAQRISDGPLPPQRAAEIVRTIADAIEYAHARGVVHRDLKPANILIDRDGQPRVTDFGLAKRTSGEGNLTATGQVLGTPGYMPPEQASGRTDQVGEAADIYALGAILYATLTGRPPFQADNAMDTLMQVLEREPAPPRELNSNVPIDLETICLKCLEKDRRRRFRFAVELGEELQRFLEGRPIESRPIGRPARVWRWCRRNPVVAGLLATVVVSMIAGTAVSAYFAVQATQQAGVALEQKAAADEATIAANKHAAEAETQRNNALAAEQRIAEALRRERLTSYVHGIGLAYRSFEAGEFQRTRQLLDECPEEHRQWEWNLIWRLCNEQQVSFTGHDCAVTDAAFSPDGRRVVSASRLRLRVWDADSGEEAWGVDLRPMERWEGRVAYGPLTPRARVAFSPDGGRIAACVHQHVTIHNAGDGRELTYVRDASAKQVAVAFAPNDNTIAVGGVSTEVGGPHGYAGGELVIRDTPDGAELLRFPRLSTAVNAIAFSPDGDQLAAGTNGAGGELPEPGEVRIWTTADGEELHVLKIRESVDPGQHVSVTSVAFDSTGGLLAAGSNDGRITIWELPAGTRHDFDAHDDGVNDVHFSPDGTQIVSVGGDRLVRVWDVARQSEQQFFAGHSSPVLSVAFAADGTRVVAAGGFDRFLPGSSMRQEAGEVRIWPLTTGRAIRKFRAGGRLSPGWKYLATVHSGGAAAPGYVEIRDLATERVLTESPPVGTSGMIAFGSGGETLLSTATDGGGRLWNTSTGRLLAEMPGQEFSGLSFHARRVALSPDSRRAATEFHGQTTLWDIGEREPDGEAAAAVPLVTINRSGSYRPFADLLFSPDGRFFVTSADHSPEGLVQIRDAETGDELFALAGGGEKLVFSEDGKRLASWSQRQGFTVWNVVDGRELLQVQTRVDREVVFSADGRLVAASTVEGPAVVWNVDDRREVLTTGEHAVTSNLAFSAAGDRIACGTTDGILLLGDVDAGTILYSASGHDGHVSQVAVSPDGLRVATAGADQVLRIWESRTARELLSIADHGHDPDYGITSIAFSSDGHSLATTGNSLVLWDGSPIGRTQ